MVKDRVKEVAGRILDDRQSNDQRSSHGAKQAREGQGGTHRSCLHGGDARERADGRGFHLQGEHGAGMPNVFEPSTPFRKRGMGSLVVS